MQKIQWRDEGEKVALYIFNVQYPDGVRYNACRTPGLYKPDYEIANGSPGYATMQNCLKRGYTYLKQGEELNWEQEEINEEAA